MPPPYRSRHNDGMPSVKTFGTLTITRTQPVIFPDGQHAYTQPVEGNITHIAYEDPNGELWEWETNTLADGTRVAVPLWPHPKTCWVRLDADNMVGSLLAAHAADYPETVSA